MRQIVMVLLVGVLASPAPAQDLAALAKKEKARRAKVATPGKVLTEEDSKESATKGAGSFTVLPGEAPASKVQEGQPQAESPAAQRAAWKVRADGVRGAVVAAQRKLEQLERDLIAFRSDMAPVPAEELQDPMRLQKREARMAEMTTSIEGQITAIVEAKKALAAFEDEARRAGVPPGWIR